MKYDFYNLSQTLEGDIFGAVQAVWKPSQPGTPLPLLQIRGGLAESPGWFMVQAAEFAPEPLSVKVLRVRDIYASESIVAALLELLAGEKWFDRIDDTYALTTAGNEIVTRMKTRRWESIDSLTGRVQTDVTQIERFMRRTLDASLESAEPPGTWCLRYSRRRAPSDSAAPLVKIFQYCEDYNAFRDDSHMAAWQPYGVAGYVWEAFSFVHGGQANYADALFDQLAYRGYSRDDYSGALQELARRGWISQDREQFKVTDSGTQVRAEAERLTDHYFYTPWQCLSDAEIDQFQALIGELQAELQKIATTAQ